MRQDRSKKRVRAYREKRYRSLDQRIVHHLEARIIRNHLVRISRPGDTILDMPVGYGRFVDDLRRHGGYVVGGDHGEAMLGLCRETFGAELPLVRLESDALPFADDSFDIVTCIRLFQHLHDPAARRSTLNEIGRVTRRHAIVTTYLTSPLHTWMHNARSGLKRLTRHSPADLHAGLEEAGLRLVSGKRSLPVLHAQYIMLLEKIDRA